MNDSHAIPLDRLERNPLITPAGLETLNRIAQHPDAPLWNYVVGDRITVEDLPEIDHFRAELAERRAAGGPAPPPAILEWAARRRDRSEYFRRKLPEGFNLERDWAYIECMTREDVAVRPELILPEDADLSRLIVYDTSGTTGHAIAVPHHPRNNAQNLPLVEFVLNRYGLFPRFGPDMTACLCVSARHTTVIFANVFCAWNQAGFAKVNLHPKDWKSLEGARRFFRDMKAFFLTGDPVGFAEMLRWDLDLTPNAMISTAVALSPGLKDLLEKRFRCPVIDWYSTTETGPVAYACPRGQLHLLPHDIYVEAVDGEGYPAPEGAAGELAVTGGRNPYLPLLRYRTGDFGRMEYGPCPCGDPTPRIVDLDGRTPVFFRAADGSVVNPVDIGRLLRGAFIFVQHEFIQRADGSCDLNLRPAPNTVLDPGRVAETLRPLFGPETEIRVHIDENLGENNAGGKVLPYRSELSLVD
ncbi:MAG: AMP-binding protein [Thermodesulfobacteriota bacterium]